MQDEGESSRNPTLDEEDYQLQPQPNTDKGD